MTYDIFSQDSFRMKVTVLENGAPKDMSGAAVSVLASTGRSTVAAAVNLANAAAGEIGFIFAAGAFQVGNAEVQVRATLNGETQTVARIDLRVAKAILTV